MTLAATYDASLSRIQLTATQLGGSASTASFARSLDGVRWTTIRGGDSVAVNSETALIDDYEFPVGVQIQYRVQTSPNNLLFENVVSLEAGVLNGEWEPDNANTAVAVTTAQAQHGTRSLQLTCTTAGQISAAVGPNYRAFVTAGQSYAAACFFRAATTGRSMRMLINWFQSNGTYISTSAAGSNVTDTTSGWTFATVVATAPALAALASPIVQSAAAVSLNEVHYVDKVGMWPGVAPLGFGWTTYITQGLSQVWLKHPTKPFLNRPIHVVDFGEIERPARGGVFNILERSYPIAVTDLRGARRFELQVLTETLEDAEEFDTILSAGEVVFLHVPTTSMVPSVYAVIEDTSERRLAFNSVKRVFSLPLTEVAQPGSDTLGGTNTWQAVINKYVNWQELLADHATWASLLEDVAAPSDVLVP